VVASPTNRQINSEMKTRVSDKNSGFSAQVDWSVGSHRVTSITARRKWSNEQFQDQDRLGTLYNAYTLVTPNVSFTRTSDRGLLDFTQTSQELRIASTQRGLLEYVAGLFYIQGKDDEEYARTATRCPATTGTVLPSGLRTCVAGNLTNDLGVANYGTNNKSMSIFGEGTWNLQPNFRAITGLRYTKDDLSYYHSRVFTPDPTTPTATTAPGIQPTRTRVNGATNETALSGRVGPQFDIAKDVMGYFTYSRGYKGPAYNVFFNMTPTQDNVLAPEKSRSLEAGLKTTLMDGKLRFNLAFFKTDYTGFQANVPDLVGGVVVTRLVNAGSVTTSGVELDATARVTPALTITAAVANVEARIVNFNCPPGAAASCDVNGKPMPFSPDWKGSLRVKYVQSLGGSLSLDYGVDMNRQSGTNFDLQQQPDSYQPAYSVWNASIALTSAAGWRVALLGKNLLNQSYATFIQNSGNNINRYVPRDDKRYFGVNARYDF
jgi:iron complex outermembrane receptor protein